MVIKEIVASTPDDIERVGISGMAAEVIVNLFAHVVDSDSQIAASEWKRVVFEGPLLCAILGGGAAKRIISPAIETVFREW